MSRSRERHHLKRTCQGQPLMEVYVAAISSLGPNTLDDHSKTMPATGPYVRGSRSVLMISTLPDSAIVTMEKSRQFRSGSSGLRPSDGVVARSQRHRGHARPAGRGAGSGLPTTRWVGRGSTWRSVGSGDSGGGATGDREARNAFAGPRVRRAINVVYPEINRETRTRACESKLTNPDLVLLHVCNVDAESTSGSVTRCWPPRESP